MTDRCSDREPCSGREQRSLGDYNRIRRLGRLYRCV